MAGWRQVESGCRERPIKRTVFEMTRRLDRGTLKAIDHAEMNGAKTEPSEQDRAPVAGVVADAVRRAVCGGTVLST